MAIKGPVDVLIARSSAIAPEPRVERAAKCLAGAGLTTLVIGWDREGRFPGDEVREEGWCLKRIYARGAYGGGWSNLPGLLRFNLGLVALCRRLRPKVFHAVDLDTAVPGLLAKWLLGARLVYDIADWYSASRLRRALSRGGALARILDRVENWVADVADYVLLPEEARLGFLRREPRRWAVVYNSPEDCVPVDAASVRIPEPYVAYVGALYEDRGIVTLIEAAEKVGTRVVLAGFGPLEGECEKMARVRQLVTFLGRVDYMTALAVQSRSIASVLTYDPALKINQYAAPYKFYEALMLGKPVIVARGTLPALIVEAEKIGMVVEYGNAEELAAAIQALRDDHGKRLEMGRRARALYEERYNGALGCARLREVYGEVLKG